MHRLALLISTAAAFAPAPRISRPLSRVGAPVPVATARVQPPLAVKLPGAEFDGCVAVQGSWLAVCRALRRNQLQRATRHRRDGLDGVGLTGLFSHSIPATLDKAREARKMIDESGYDIRLEIDGGVRSRRPAVLCAFTPSTRLVSIRRGREWFLLRFRGRSDRVERPRCSAQVSGANIKEVAEAGVDMFVAGSAIFRDPRTEEAYKKTIDAMRDELAAAKVPANKVAA